jgi:hypothetical protein
MLLSVHCMRKSKLFFERNVYDELHKKIFKSWETRERFVLEGNDGIGKSWFQIYVLHRLLNMKENKYCFLVHQVETAFYLYRFETCQVWELQGRCDHHVKDLLNSIETSLYFFEPGVANVSPFGTALRSISFVSPRDSRIRIYVDKIRLLYLDMPDWTLDEH